MRLVLIGCDDEVIDAVASMKLPAGSRIVAFADDRQEHQLRRLDCDVRPMVHYSSALNERDVTAFFVANEPPLMDSLRLLAQSGQPILVTHPACSMIEGFELQMIQADTGSVIQPVFPGINHPILDVLGDWRSNPENSPVGAIRQFAIQRPLDSKKRNNVLDAFARDAFLMRRLLTRVDCVNAIGIDSLDQADWSSLSVQMMGHGALVGRWTSVPESVAKSARLDVIGEDGAAVAVLRTDPSTWTLETTAPQREAVALPPYDGAAELLDRFSGPQPNPLMARDWEHACRAAELVDAVEQSSRRGKTISLHHEQHTEEATFKSVMAAGGCLLLMGLVGFVVLLQTLQTARPEIKSWSGWSFIWPALFVVLFGFLSLQLLRLVFQRSED